VRGGQTIEHAKQLGISDTNYMDILAWGSEYDDPADNSAAIKTVAKELGVSEQATQAVLAAYQAEYKTITKH
jgi:hypothetical protein